MEPWVYVLGFIAVAVAILVGFAILGMAHITKIEGLEERQTVAEEGALARMATPAARVKAAGAAGMPAAIVAQSQEQRIAALEATNQRAREEAERQQREREDQGRRREEEDPTRIRLRNQSERARQAALRLTMASNEVYIARDEIDAQRREGEAQGLRATYNQGVGVVQQQTAVATTAAPTGQPQPQVLRVEVVAVPPPTPQPAPVAPTGQQPVVVRHVLAINGVGIRQGQIRLDIQGGGFVTINPAPGTQGYDEGTQVSLTVNPNVAGATVVVQGAARRGQIWVVTMDRDRQVVVTITAPAAQPAAQPQGGQAAGAGGGTGPRPTPTP